MKTKFLLVAIAIIVMVCVDVKAQHLKMSACDLRTDFRKLFEDHITWTRNVILNIIDTLPGAETAVPRLLQNQVDIGNGYAMFYGKTVGDSIAALFTIHITTAADLLNALVSGNATAIAAANAAWYDNGEDIVAYLTSINPFYDEETLDEMMDMHLDLTADEALARLNHNYAADIAAYDSVHLEVLAMSDFLAAGIVAQFPQYFKGKARMAQQVELSDGVVLSQNVPNPFNDKTVISYSIPEGNQSSQIIFRDVTGRVIRTVPIEGSGDGDLTVYSHMLSKGVYTYSIVIDGKEMDVKKMLH